MRLRARWKDWRRRRLLAHAGIGVDIARPRWSAGARSGVWVVDPTRLGPGSAVVAVGIGDNIAWDLAMIARFGCTVHACDPTPRAVAFLATQRLPAEFVHHAVAIAHRDGELAFAEPRSARDVNYRPQAGASGGAFRAPCERLATLSRRLGLDRLDVLKLDIEGGEYEVLDDLLAHGPAIRQLLVEFHHGEGGIPFAQTERAIARLRAAGYRILDVSRRGLEFTFVANAP